MLFVSAKTKQRLVKIYKTAKDVWAQCTKRLSTSILNKILLEALAMNPPTTKKGKKLRILYATQVRTAPPSFIMFVNNEDLVQESYKRFLENKLRENDRLKEQMQNQLQILEHKKEEVDQMMREQNVRLEQISGLSSEEAKNILIENMKAEAKTEAAAYINETIEEAKMTATKEA